MIQVKIIGSNTYNLISLNIMCIARTIVIFNSTIDHHILNGGSVFEVHEHGRG